MPTVRRPGAAAAALADATLCTEADSPSAAAAAAAVLAPAPGGGRAGGRAGRRQAALRVGGEWIDAYPSFIAYFVSGKECAASSVGGAAGE
ncbi:hypothetical protein T492DRAFT_869590 [Pavlovales sp. CCMP2436]|nr:hypothetical protein T492DRAFT_869590 [Pavlovales sp. CCMP2436]